MTAHFEWADLRRLIEQSFFYRTMDLYLLEEKLHTPIHDSLHWSRRFEYPWIIGRLQDRVEPIKTILDVGAGATAIQFLLADLGHDVSSIDPDPTAFNWVNRTSLNRHSIKDNRFGSLPILPFADGQFDISICISVLEHLPKDQVLPSIKELLRVSKKEVLITMDICLDKNEKQQDMLDLAVLDAEIKLNCAMIPREALTFHIDGYEFGVACIHIAK